MWHNRRDKPKTNTMTTAPNRQRKAKNWAKGILDMVFLLFFFIGVGFFIVYLTGGIESASKDEEVETVSTPVIQDKKLFSGTGIFTDLNRCSDEAGRTRTSYSSYGKIIENYRSYLDHDIGYWYGLDRVFESYLIHDLNGDGVDELVFVNELMKEGKGAPGLLFTQQKYEGKTQVCLVREFWSRSRLLIGADGKIHDHGSSSAATSSRFAYVLQDGKLVLESGIGNTDHKDTILSGGENSVREDDLVLYGKNGVQWFESDTGFGVYLYKVDKDGKYTPITPDEYELLRNVEDASTQEANATLDYRPFYEE